MSFWKHVINKAPAITDTWLSKPSPSIGTLLASLWHACPPTRREWHSGATFWAKSSRTPPLLLGPQIASYEVAARLLDFHHVMKITSLIEGRPRNFASTPGIVTQTPACSS